MKIKRNYASPERLEKLKIKSLRDDRGLVTQSLEGASFVGEELSDLIFESDCDETHWSDAKLNDIEYCMCALSGVNFDQAELINCTFFDCYSNRASFRSTTLRNVKFAGGALINAEFVGSVLIDVSFETNALGHGIDLSNADFSGAIFENVSFYKSKFNSRTVFPSGFKPALIEGLKRMD